VVVRGGGAPLRRVLVNSSSPTRSPTRRFACLSTDEGGPAVRYEPPFVADHHRTLRATRRFRVPRDVGMHILVHFFGSRERRKNMAATTTRTTRIIGFTPQAPCWRFYAVCGGRGRAAVHLSSGRSLVQRSEELARKASLGAQPRFRLGRIRATWLADRTKPSGRGPMGQDESGARRRVISDALADRRAGPDRGRPKELRSPSRFAG